jgi:AraC family transcriptional regulator of arabinose operon
MTDNLKIYECGREKCTPEKDIRNANKKYHLFHLVLNGFGYFEYKEEKFKLKKGDIFFIPKNTSCRYYPKRSEPWEYVWLGIEFDDLEQILTNVGVNEDNRIFKDKSNELRNLFLSLVDVYKQSKEESYLALGYAYLILGKINSSKKETKPFSAEIAYVNQAKEFIRNNYQFPIRITQIADSLSITPEYLSALFRKNEGCSTKQYLINERISKALNILKETDTSIKDIAKNTGFENQLYFSNSFKKAINISPSEYRKKYSIK